MQEQWTIDLIWWITVVELPALAGLFWLIWRSRRESDTALDDTRHEFETSLVFVRESLSAFKLDVAKNYASISYLKEVERRLTDHLVRIEEKIDNQRTPGAGGVS